jgi:hypothetical protein
MRFIPVWIPGRSRRGKEIFFATDFSEDIHPHYCPLKFLAMPCNRMNISFAPLSSVFVLIRSEVPPMREDSQEKSGR